MNISDSRLICICIALWAAVGCSSKPAHLSIVPSTLQVKASKETPGGQQVTVATALRNVGGRPLKVLGVSSSCNCTVATPETSEALAPGREMPLTIKVSLPLFGRRESVVVVQTDAPETPSARLVIQIEGDDEPVPRVVMQTQNLELRGTATGQLLRGELEIQSVERPGTEPWVSRLHSSSPMIQVKRRDSVSEDPVAEDIVYRRYVFDVQATSPESGRIFVNVTPEFTSPAKQPATFISRVTLETVNPVSVVPSQLVVSRDELKSGFARRVIVLSKDGQPFQIRSVRWQADSMSGRSLIDSFEHGESTVQKFELKFVPQASDASAAEAFVDIETTHPTVPRCRLPVRIRSDG